MLEVVLASALLGIVAAGIMGTVSMIWGWQGRQQETLGAAEVANRLILTYLDDSTVLPSSNLPIAYGQYRYHWKMERTPAKFKEPDDLPPEVAEKRAARVTPTTSRIEMVKVRVWLSEECPGGSLRAEADTPQAMLERLVDPLAFRNPDSVKKWFGHMDKMGAKLSDIQQGAGDDSGGNDQDEKAVGGGR
jgi:type II secretory pathway pseudopilin PulG